jgi:NAD(P)-dependent dehydrogenase (short-subunit alcohol dehydrogenase family)
MLLRLVHSAPDCLVVTDLDGRVLSANSAFVELAQLATEEQVRGETLDRWLTMLRVNLIAAAALNRACRPLLQASPSASVVLTVESHALSPSMFWGGFALSKQALLSLMAVQAQEWRVFTNLRINALLPGPVATPQRNRTHPAEDASTLPGADRVAAGYLYLLDPAGTPASWRISAKM